MKTTTNAVRNTLKKLGHEIYSASYGYGVTVRFDKNEGCIVVTDKHFGEQNLAALELRDAGFDAIAQNKFVTFVYGKVGA
jgi:restriction endonuclease S subunit